MDWTWSLVPLVAVLLIAWFTYLFKVGLPRMVACLRGTCEHPEHTRP